jgi:hypothetical protein
VHKLKELGMEHGHSKAIVWCHDIDDRHATCSNRGTVPAILFEERLMLKSCMLQSRDCKYQNEIGRASCRERV